MRNLSVRPYVAILTKWRSFSFVASCAELPIIMITADTSQPGRGKEK